ncbi:MAG: thiamine pyrophosphate-dependent enzyme [Erysipelotrichaceae bacterium]|nr:thiamine pyrophosphate-dependent enzyme [Erysipelotrichaceae bacterium]
MTDFLFQKTNGLTDKQTHYCPGCTHGIIHRLVAEVLEDLNVVEETIAIASVGCSVLSYEYFNTDSIQASHGRAPAVATGIKRVFPNQIVFTYQGDGDLASIGLAEIIAAAGRGENITVIFVNNAIYGMTGGQMAPTSLVGQKTSTSPLGRNPLLAGMPLKMCEIMSQIPSVEYVSRVSTHSPLAIRQAKVAIKKAFENQRANRGFSFVEILSSCNIGWGLPPVEALKWIESRMISYYPLGVYKDGKDLE